MKEQNIVIFASGAGTNAAKCMEYFSTNTVINIVALITNNPNSGAIDHAEKHKINSFVFDNSFFNNGDFLVSKLKELNANYIILAGFLRKIPQKLIQLFEDRIINIHPSLLPKYGGKGMYGNNVHQAVLANKDLESGITIHIVNEVFDNGRRVAQFFTPLDTNETLLSLKAKIQYLEHHYFAPTIELYIKTRES